MQNRHEERIRQTFSVPLKQRFTKIITVSLGSELVRVHVSMFWLGTSSQNIYNIIKVSNISFDTLMIRPIIYLHDLLISSNSINKIFIARDSVIFLLQHLGFMTNLKKFVLNPAQEREILGFVVNSQSMTL